MENINEKIADLIDTIDSGNNIEAENIFNDILQDKIDAILGIAKEEVAASMFNTEECAECDEEMNEALKGNQHKIDTNKNGKIDAQDFKMLRKKKMKEAYADPYAAKKAAEMKKKKEEAMAAAKKEYDASQESKGKVDPKKFMKMEDVEIQELKKSTLQSYVKKAEKEQGDAAYDYKYAKSEGGREDAEHRMYKRDDKIALARKKMKTANEETEHLDEVTYSAKMARAGKDIGKSGKMFKKISAKAARKYGKQRGVKIAGAVLAKLRKKGK